MKKTKSKASAKGPQVYGSIYNIFPSDNCTPEAPFVIAEVQEVRTPNKTVLQAFKSPDDFAAQSMDLIRIHMLDEMIDKGLFDKMKITITVEYSLK